MRILRDATGATGDVSMSMAGDATGKRMLELEETSSASSSIGKGRLSPLFCCLIISKTLSDNLRVSCACKKIRREREVLYILK